MAKMTKVVFVHHGKILGGAPISLRNTLLELKREEKFNLMVLCVYENMCTFFKDSAGVKSKVISHPRLIFGRVLIGWASICNLKTFAMTLADLFFLPFSIFKQYRDLMREYPDIVHLNSSILYSTAITAKLAGFPVVWHVREVLTGSKYNLRRIFAGWLIRSLADKVICISPVEAKSLGKDKRKKVEVVFNFIDFSKFNYEGIDISAEKEKFGIKKNQKTVLSLGGVSFRKGAFEIIESCKYLSDDFVVLIAGPHLVEVRKGLTKHLISYVLLHVEDLCIKLGIKKVYSWDYNYRVWKNLKDSNHNNLMLIGQQENIVPLLAISDVLVFAGRTPHFPRPVYEAWAMKKPVVVFDMDGVSQNISDGNDGVIAKEAKGRFLAAAIREILSRPKEAKEMGERGYLKAIDAFDVKKNIKQITRIYNSLLSNNRS